MLKATVALRQVLVIVHPPLDAFLGRPGHETFLLRVERYSGVGEQLW